MNFDEKQQDLTFIAQIFLHDAKSDPVICQLLSVHGLFRSRWKGNRETRQAKGP